ncbi:MAG: hypothetical protein K9L77_03950 [Candidatus Omnitrophica bacterium]|nr:hypothetical protein [Candidatus Omnitrophota bacterium]
MIKTKKAVSLVEILAAALILSFVVGGLISAFLGVRRYIRHAKERATAANLSRSHLRTLLSQVRNDSWNSGGLSAGTSQSLPTGSEDWSDIDNIDYEGANTQYQVSHIAGQDYRQVNITIEYPD